MRIDRLVRLWSCYQPQNSPVRCITAASHCTTTVTPRPCLYSTSTLSPVTSTLHHQSLCQHGHTSSNHCASGHCSTTATLPPATTSSSLCCIPASILSLLSYPNTVLPALHHNPASETAQLLSRHSPASAARVVPPIITHRLIGSAAAAAI